MPSVGNACEERRRAQKGSEFWCSCNGRGELIRKKSACEALGGGREALCQWSLHSSKCVPKRDRAESSQFAIVPPIECALPRGTDRAWHQHFAQSRYRLTFATWNVEWLFDGINDEMLVPNRSSLSAVEDRIHKIAQVLKRLNADIVHFVEVENCQMLSRVGMNLGGSYQPYLVEGVDSALRQQVGLLSKLRPLRPIARTLDREPVMRHGSQCGDIQSEGGKSTSVSKHLIASFSPMPGHEIVVIGLHLKAFPLEPRSCHQREGQAAVVGRLVEANLKEGRHVVVLGDFNDFDADVLGVDGQAPTSIVLKIIKDPDGDGVLDLSNVLENVPIDERYTNWYDSNRDRVFQFFSERSLLDHILVSTSLLPMVEAVGIDHSTDPTRVSDHWPVWVRFNFETWASPSSLVDPVARGTHQKEVLRDQRADQILNLPLRESCLLSVVFPMILVLLRWLRRPVLRLTMRKGA